MMFAEEDAPLIKAWIVRRLENNSDADAEVLADYVLALLRHDGDVETIRKLFEEEIPDFLREDAATFTDDVLQAAKYRSYLPGAPPPPPPLVSPAHIARQPHFPPPAALAHVAPRPDIMPLPTSLYHPSAPYSAPLAPPPFSQAGSRKRTYNDRDDGDVDIIINSQPPYGPPFKQPRRGGGFGQRGGRYEDPYAPKSYRGAPRFPGPPEYDPNNAALSLPPFNIQQPPAVQQLELPNLQLPPPPNRREPKKPRRIKGRAPFATNGPNYDKTKRALVVQNIPSENFTEDQVCGYFSQFGGITEVSMQTQNRLATIKFDSWEAANSAWSSPKVIFDNRFVKVFWSKEEGSDETIPNGKLPNNTTNGHVDGTALPGELASAKPELDMEEFYRRQLEAQKIHNEKVKKRQEIERERQELQERQRDLRERQAEAKRQLEAKLKENGIKDGSPAEIKTENGDTKPSAQTEALKARLAALEQEANQLGLDPDDNHDDNLSWAPRGSGRGRGYRGRGTFAPRASRGTYGYQGRGGTVEARHAAYAAYSLDNRPKIVALSGVDFMIPENDEALRQYLFSVGEFKEVHSAPAITHVTFKDRKTAEKFMFGVSASNSIYGIEGKIEPTWAKTAPESAKTANGDIITGTLDDEQANKGKMDISAGDVNGELEEGEIDNAPDHDQGDMDYEAGEW
ncbi:hypothetical protein E0Z10_g4027 [Xylaria hypoxylon]|uniref:RRM domain-containing protein n=1 Tax=Xylaria hypoxylon TaxID=37992 RepID=A0A4Z0YZV1_9PEZI|nr:hypothetical protein E0Z10_g4027 [Xylaria hypoxylon]